jgi:hypothetical protein
MAAGPMIVVAETRQHQGFLEIVRRSGTDRCAQHQEGKAVLPFTTPFILGPSLGSAE